MSPYEYYKQIRFEDNLSKHEQQIEFLTNHTFRALVLSVIRPLYIIFRGGKYLKLRHRTIAQEPRGKYPSESFAIVDNIQNDFIIRKKGTFSSCKNKGKLINTKNNKIIFIHAYYKSEAESLFNIISHFEDYDIVVTSPFDFIFDNVTLNKISNRLVRIKIPNHGRDVYPFLSSLNLIDINKYKSFIKIHTKKSQHLSDKGVWFTKNVKYLLGNKDITDHVLDYISSMHIPIVTGESTLHIDDHYKTNKFWMNELIPEVQNLGEYSFIPGTMFLGNGIFLKLIRDRHLEDYIFEDENMQLDGCAMHAIERYFGYLAQSNSGICSSLEEFSFRYLHD